MPKNNLKCQLRKKKNKNHNSVRKASKWLGNKTKPNQECIGEEQTQQNDVAPNALPGKALSHPSAFSGLQLSRGRLELPS